MIWGARRGSICVGVRESKLWILGSESVNNPERPFITLIHSYQRQFYFYLVIELLVIYIHWVMHL